MKICLYGFPGVTAGRMLLRDPRLDTAHRLVEADKKTYAAVDVVGEEGLAEADAIAVPEDRALDLILLDLEFVETRLGRATADAEKEALRALQAELEAGRCLCHSTLPAAVWQAVEAHTFHTRKPVVTPLPEDAGNLDPLLLRTFAAAGWQSFLTVGGKENRAWPIRAGSTAWDAAGSIHTDIQKGFIRAEIIGWDDFVAAGGEIGAKRAGKQRLETRDYLMRDCDLVNFRFNK